MGKYDTMESILRVGKVLALSRCALISRVETEGTLSSGMLLLAVQRGTITGIDLINHSTSFYTLEPLSPMLPSAVSYNWRYRHPYAGGRLR